MSGQATGWVLRNGPHPDMLDRNGVKYGARARGLRSVMIGVADAANSDGRHSHPGNENLCAFALYGRRQVTTLLGELVAEQWLAIEEEGGGRGRATQYAIPLMATELTAQSLHGYVERYRAVHGSIPRSPDAQTAQCACETAQSNGARQRVATNDDNERATEPRPSGSLVPVDEGLPDVVKNAGHVDDARRLCQLMHDQLVERGYKPNAPTSKRWVLDMEALLRLDERSAHEVELVLVWLHTGTDDVAQFWRTNILSPSKLRTQWQRMRDQYHAKVKGQRSRGQQQISRDLQQRGLNPDEVAADADALTRDLFGPGDPGDSALSSSVIDVESRG